METINTTQAVEAIEETFDKIALLNHHKKQIILTYLQKAAAELDTSSAMKLRGKILGGGKSIVESAAVVTTGPQISRFNTTPPTNIFADPKTATDTTKGTAQPVAHEPEQSNEGDTEDDAVKRLYETIAKMTPGQIVSQYGESSISGMIKKMGGDDSEIKRPNQKAALLQTLIKEHLA